MACFAATAQAILTNGGFENGDFTGWTKLNASNHAGLQLPVPFTLSSIRLSEVGKSTELTSIVGTSQDPRTDNLLPLPGAGKYTARINDARGHYNVNAISQTDTLTALDLGADGKYHIRFSYAAVLEDPKHDPEEQPYFYVLLQDVTSNEILYSELTYANQPGRNFHVSNTYHGWLWTDWNNVDIALPGSSLGHRITITAMAADCSLGGHAGYVYLDGFGSQPNIVAGMTLVALSPGAAIAGNPAFSLTVTGTGFQDGDAVQWGGSHRETTYVSATQLAAAITAADIAAVGSQKVTVVRGSQVSSPLAFASTSSIPVVTPVTAVTQVFTNPLSNVTVDAAGAVVVTKTIAPMVLNPAAPEGAVIKLETRDPVIVESGTTTLRYTDQLGAAQLVVRTVSNQPQLEVAKGIVEISAPLPGTIISVVSSGQKSTGSITTQTTDDSVTVARTDIAVKVFVDTGKVTYQVPTQVTGISLFQGENIQLDTGGTPLQVALGSLDGRKHVPGDPLPVVTIPKDAATKVPNLDGLLPRFDNTVSLLDLVRDKIKEVTGDASGQLSYDSATGVISYVSGTTTLRLIPLGDILVQFNRFADSYPTTVAGGAYTVTLAGGIQMSLSAAVGYFSDLQAAVKALDAAGTLSLKPTGAIEVRLVAGRYVVMPGSTASLPDSPTFSPGFEIDASSNLVFRDHLGTRQALYPAFLDADTLSSTFKSALPTIILTSNGDGTVTASLGGQNYILRPEYLVVDSPLANALDAYWLDSGMVYLHNADLSAQAFRVH